ncbi:winged helix-turn-helix domain-containing protein [Roseibacterium sp. SDUM158016]|uniref:winged helix-turn-helix domain-containing protein n=1 Tax=Roseicyclus sediminis TaxID=2980997 RepID=UPI0021D37739|nr:winged helix-turn-helix domain-containing protein [Roseibacterium sp. SDUM158016]MCU4654971.1 winged helix-turn-helix domain-containing protein [Roseibacterium sp. SDUM158016]
MTLRNQSQKVLVYLLAHVGQVVERDDIIGHVWPQKFVSDDSLAQCIRDIRLAIGDATREVLETVPGRGFRLHAETEAPARPPSPVPTLLIDEITGGEQNEEVRALAGMIREDMLEFTARRKGVRVTSNPRHAETADYTMSGSARQVGNAIRVFLSLEAADADEGQIWSESFEVAGETLAVWSRRIARKATNVQRVSAIAGFGRRFAGHADAELDLQQLLAKAAYRYARITVADTAAARRTLEHAVERYPESPMALAMLAATSVHMLPHTPVSEARTEAESAMALAERAVFHGPEIDYALRTRANIRFWMQGDLAGARADCETAFRITPNYQMAHVLMTEIELFEGDHAAARARMDRFLVVDPALPQFFFFRSLQALFALLEGDTASARAYASEGYRIAPWSDWCLLVHAMAHAGDASLETPEMRSRIAASRIGADALRDLPITDAALQERLVGLARDAGA